MPMVKVMSVLLIALSTSMSELTADCTPKATALPRSSGNSSTPGITLSSCVGTCSGSTGSAVVNCGFAAG
eukprot:1193856-Prorocentrum_minimum.AAC.1